MLIIFDLDGTLLNTIDDLSAAANHALTMCGFEPRTVEECRNFVGNGVTKLLERALPPNARTAENLVRIRNAFFMYYEEHLWDNTHPYDGIEKVLTTLQTRGLKLAVASNKYQSATQRLIAHFFPQHLFAAILGQRENIPIKPHPQIVHEILALTKETLAHTLYVGDSKVDMQTAQHAGVKACAVTWGFRSRRELIACNPVHIIDYPEELLELDV